MIRVPMTASSLATTRFAVSRLSEAFDGLRALSDPAANGHLRSWVRWARPRIRNLDLSLLDGLVRTGGYVPDFLVPPPPPPSLDSTLDAELAGIRATPADRVGAELDLAYRGRPPPARVGVALADGEQAFLEHVTVALRRFWDAAMDPWWPTIRTVLEDDIGYRARMMARHGAATALTQMDRSLRWDDSCLEIARPATFDADWADGGVIFSPTVFGGPHLYLSLQPWIQSVIYYPARNVINGRALRPYDAHHGSAELLGRTRSEILSQLDRPRST
ncbi:MAG TPA: DUF5937 family protein, partial [Euzebyales bacterium]|nr:DUF5937 family protein [Euzebyales bacterium]